MKPGCIGVLLYVQSFNRAITFAIFAMEGERHFKLSIFRVIFKFDAFSPGKTLPR